MHQTQHQERDRRVIEGGAGQGADSVVIPALYSESNSSRVGAEGACRASPIYTLVESPGMGLPAGDLLQRGSRTPWSPSGHTPDHAPPLIMPLPLRLTIPRGTRPQHLRRLQRAAPNGGPGCANTGWLGGRRGRPRPGPWQHPLTRRESRAGHHTEARGPGAQSSACSQARRCHRAQLLAAGIPGRARPRHVQCSLQTLCWQALTPVQDLVLGNGLVQTALTSLDVPETCIEGSGG